MPEDALRKKLTELHFLWRQSLKLRMFLVRLGGEATEKIRTNSTCHLTIGFFSLRWCWASVFKEWEDNTLDLFIIKIKTKLKQNPKKNTVSKGNNSWESLGFREVLFLISTADLGGLTPGSIYLVLITKT